MTTLREKMKREMLLIGLADSTQQRYLQTVTRLYDYYQQSPATLSVPQIRDYLVHLKKSPSLRTLTISPSTP
jgi:predicted phosphoadenosine phosphosulfate sulfurtransferase